MDVKIKDFQFVQLIRDFINMDDQSVLDAILSSVDIGGERQAYELCKYIHLREDKYREELIAKCDDKIDKEVFEIGFGGECKLDICHDLGIVKFWKALVSNKVQVNGEFLELPIGTNWIKKNIGRLYIRKCYEDLYKIIKDSNFKYYSILGTPGIGKTCFGQYCMYRLIDDKKSIVYQYTGFGENIFIYFSYFNKKVYTAKDYSSIEPILNDNEGIVYICDAMKPIHFGGTTILITSTKREIYKEYHKFGANVVKYMPVWSNDEIRQINGSKELDESFGKVGGIPRYIVEKNISSLSKDLEDAISSIAIEKLAEYDGSTDESKDVRSLLVHINVDDRYEKKYVTFASKYIRDRLYDKFLIYNLRKFGDTIKSFADRPGGSLLGELFESYMHKILPKGNAFKVRELNQNRKRKNDEENLDQSNELILDVTGTKIFRQINDINLEYFEKYCIPYVSNFSSVDSLVISNNMEYKFFQITINPNHPIKQKGLNKLIDHIDSLFDKENKKDIELYFVVPNNIYDSFKLQPIIKDRGDVSQTIPKRMQKIKQYALCVDLDINLDE